MKKQEHPMRNPINSNLFQNPVATLTKAATDLAKLAGKSNVAERIVDIQKFVGTGKDGKNKSATLSGPLAKLAKQFAVPESAILAAFQAPKKDGETDASRLLNVSGGAKNNFTYSYNDLVDLRDGLKEKFDKVLTHADKIYDKGKDKRLSASENRAMNVRLEASQHIARAINNINDALNHRKVDGFIKDRPNQTESRQSQFNPIAHGARQIGRQVKNATIETMRDTATVVGSTAVGAATVAVGTGPAIVALGISGIVGGGFLAVKGAQKAYKVTGAGVHRAKAGVRSLGQMETGATVRYKALEWAFRIDCSDDPKVKQSHIDKKTLDIYARRGDVQAALKSILAAHPEEGTFNYDYNKKAWEGSPMQMVIAQGKGILNYSDDGWHQTAQGVRDGQVEAKPSRVKAEAQGSADADAEGASAPKRTFKERIGMKKSESSATASVSPGQSRSAQAKSLREGYEAVTGNKAGRFSDSKVLKWFKAEVLPNLPYGDTFGKIKDWNSSELKSDFETYVSSNRLEREG
jgi:hypothetical protein